MRPVIRVFSGDAAMGKVNSVGAAVWVSLAGGRTLMSEMSSATLYS